MTFYLQNFNPMICSNHANRRKRIVIVM